MTASDATILGLGVPVKYDGQTYTLGPLNLEDCSYFSTWLEERAWQGHERSARHMTPDKVEARANALELAIGAGVYEFPAPLFVQGVQSLAGLKRMALIALRTNVPQTTEEFAGELVAERFEEVAKAIGVLLSDPKEMMRRSLGGPARRGGAASPTPNSSAS